MSSDDLVYVDQALVAAAFFSGIVGGIFGAAAFALIRVAAGRAHRMFTQWR